MTDFFQETMMAKWSIEQSWKMTTSFLVRLRIPVQTITHHNHYIYDDFDGFTFKSARAIGCRQNSGRQIADNKAKKKQQQR